MKVRILTWMMVLSCCSLLASPTIDLPALKAPSLIDGELTEESWKEAYKTGTFTSIKEGELTEKAEGYIFRDQESLFIGIRCYFQDYDAKVNLLKSANKPFSGDNVEIFLDPGETGNYCHIAVNIAGNLFFAGKQAPIQVAVQLHNHDWTLEARIPFNALKLSPAVKYNSTWKINLARGNESRNEFSSWSPVRGGSFHDHENFNVLSDLKINLVDLQRRQELKNRGAFTINLDHIIYSDQEKLKAVLDLKYTKNMKGFSLIADIRDQAGKTVKQRTIRPVFFKNAFEISLDNLGTGRFQLRLNLRDAQGKSVMSGEKDFWKVPPKSGLPSPHFTLKNNCLYRDGKFFFPIITWQCGADSFRKDKQTYLEDTETIFQELEDHGFNTIMGFAKNFPEENYADMCKFGTLHTWHRKTFLACKKAGITFQDFIDLAQKHHLHLVMSSCYLKDVTPKNIDLFVRQMTRIRDKKNIMLWHTADETDGRVAENLIMHQLYKEIDPYRLTWLNVINAVAQNRHNAHILSTDPYPIPNGKITAVSVHTDRLLSYVQGQEQSQWLWIQMFGGEGNWTRPPDAAEVRAMVYLAMNHGIKGLAYFVWRPPHLRNGIRQDPKAWQSLKTLNREITHLAPMFCLGEKVYTGVQQGIDIAVIRHEGNVYVSLVNTQPKPSGKLVLSIPDCKRKTFQFNRYETQMVIH